MKNKKELTDEDLMPFGKHKDKPLSEVPDSYLLWLHEKGCNHPALRRYIKENLEGIKANIQRERAKHGT